MAVSRIQHLRLRVSSARHESGKLLLVLVLENRTRRIQQHSAGPDRLPQAVQQTTLQGQQRGQVFRAAMQQHIRLPPHDAGRRARRVQQHRIEGFTVPPRLWIGRIGGAQFRFHADAHQSFAYTVETARIDIQRDQTQGRIAFQQMRGLAARCGAGVQYARARRQPQRIGHLLRGSVLHRGIALGEAGQRRHGNGNIDAQRIGQIRLDTGNNACLLQTPGVIVAGALASIHPQPQRGRMRAGLENRIRVFSPFQIDLLAQPRRPCRGRIGFGKPFALRTPQQRIDHARLVRPAQRPRGFHCGRQRGVRRQAHRIDLGETHQQQRTQIAVFFSQRFLQPELQGRLVARALPQRGEADRLQQCAVARIGQLSERGDQFAFQGPAAVDDRLQYLGGEHARGDAGRCIHGVTRSRRAFR